jgi:hypothetical protein
MSLRLSLIAASALALASTAAFAAPQAAGPAMKSLTPQQQRMSDCSKQSAGKKGADYKAAVSACLKGQSAAAPAKQTQQEKMKSCNTEASGKALKGADRKSFMSSCLKGGATATP